MGEIRMQFLTKNFENKVVTVVEKATKCVVSVVASENAQGSGVIIASDGYIVTNAHVVEGKEKVDVSLHDGCILEARVIGRSNVKDIAILKTQAKNLDYMKMGESSKLKVGKFCIAIGNSLGLGTTVTFGMVSGLNRSIPSTNVAADGMLQVSAPINPGNSGGALIDLEGNLIGIPTMMVMFAAGVGFAIASDDVKDLYVRLLETGTIRSPTLGMVAKTVDIMLAAKLNLPSERGAVVVRIGKGPALAAGLKQSDVIISVDGSVIYSMEDLRKYIIRKRLGESVVMKVLRGDESLEFKIFL
jgi:serine protease Do